MPFEHCYARFVGGEAVAAMLAEPDEVWLSERERLHLETLRSPQRRCSWRAGRVLAKQLLIDCGAVANVEPGEIEIQTPRDDRARAMRPVVAIGGEIRPWSLSLSHTEGAVLAAVSFDRRASLGVDLVLEHKFARGFVATWFSEREQHQLTAADPQEIAVRWAIKEAVYKACQQGEGFAPRRIEVLDSVNADGGFSGRTPRKCFHDPTDCLVPLGRDVECVYHGINLSEELSIEILRTSGFCARGLNRSRAGAELIACLVGLTPANGRRLEVPKLIKSPQFASQLS